MNTSKQTTYLSNTKLGYCSILLRIFLNFLNTSQDREKQVIHVVSLPHTRITWVSFLGLKEPLLKLLHLAKQLRSNSSPTSISLRFKMGHLFSRNMNYNMNFLLQLHVEIHIILQYIRLALHPEVEMNDNIIHAWDL